MELVFDNTHVPLSYNKHIVRITVSHRRCLGESVVFLISTMISHIGLSFYITGKADMANIKCLTLCDHSLLRKEGGSINKSLP